MLSAIVAGALLAGSNGVLANSADGQTELTLQGTPFHSTTNKITQLRTLSLAGGAVVTLWNEAGREMYAVSLDGMSVQRVAEAKNTLEFQYEKFDPAVSSPAIPDRLKAATGSELFVVQFETQSLGVYRRAIEAAGGEVLSYLPNNAHVVRMSGETKAAVEAMGFVRYVGNYEPAFRIDPVITRKLLANVLGATRYNILLADKTPDNKDRAAVDIRQLGGTVHEYAPGGRLIEATLTPDQLVQLANNNNVLWIDLWGPMEPDMDIARIFHGTNNLETLTGGNPTGYSGEGVVGMARDTELRTTHQEFAHMPPIMLAGSPSSFHGTAVFGIIFAKGVNAAARGVIPDAQGVFRPGLTTGATRYAQTQEAINNHNVVFETNSTGSTQVTTYTSVSADMDDLIFDLNLTVCQSQSNTNSQNSRPQAWAKNIVSVGALNHQNTVTPDDDVWGGASIGPASDGRLKPDLASFYDSIFTTSNSSNTSYTSNFGGTSGATPITCGHFGLIYQMWSKGDFNNTAYGNTVFTSKCNNTTAKALMINRAKQWSFSGTGHNRSRYKQGWGHAQVDDVWLYRDKGFVVDETDVLQELGVKQYRFFVAPGETSLNATMVYKDLPGNPSVQSQHRVNDLTLRVVDPGGNVYWGNNGLAGAMTSPIGGAANTKDTVENVLIANPATGIWTVEVSAPELNGDTHVQTVGVEDADFALVVTGVSGAMNLPTVNESLEAGIIASGALSGTHQSDNDKLVVRPGIVFATGQAPVRYVREVQAPTAVGDLWVSVEASATSPNVGQRVELWNWNTGQWDQVMQHGNLTTTDTARTLFLGVPTNYVNGTNNIRTRVSYYASGPVVAYPWETNIDHVRVYFAP
jgi:hypothetical protein